MQKALIALALVASPVLAADLEGFTKVTGDMTITSKNYTDPGPNEKLDRVGFVLTGAAAKRIYHAMPVKPIKEACAVEGATQKTAGTLSCFRENANSYTCMFGIVLANGKGAQYGEC